MRSRWVAPILILCAAALASIAFAALNDSGGTAEPLAQEPLPQPTAQTAPAGLMATPIAVTPTPLVIPPQPSPVPAATPAQDPEPPAPYRPSMVRSGESCSASFSVSPDDESKAQWVFTLPERMVTRDCERIEFTDIEDDPCCPALTVRSDPRFIASVLFELIADTDTSLESAQWVRIHDRGAWLLDARDTSATNGAGSSTGRMERTLLVNLGAETFVVTTSYSEASEDQRRLSAMDELTATLFVPSPAEDSGRWSQLPTSFCTGEGWTVEIPEDWFVYGKCDASQRSVRMNTSDLADIVMQCECLGPIWFDEAWSLDPIVFGTEVTVLSDRATTRSDGVPIRVVEAVLGDGHIGRRELRGVTVDLGSDQLTIVANRTVDHAAPLHTWEDTIEAQDFLVERIRSWAEPFCVPDRELSLLRTIADTPLLASNTGPRQVHTIPAGTVLTPSGCRSLWFDGVTPMVEARVGSIAGWVPTANVVEAVGAQCATEARFIEEVDDVTLWDEMVEGDFDGDGKLDTMLLRGADFGASVGEQTRVSDLPPAEMTVVYATGSVAGGTLESEEFGNFLAFGQGVEVIRPVGLGRDVLLVADPFKRGAYTSQVYVLGVASCQPKIFGQLSWGASVGNQFAYCVAETDFGAIVRSWYSRGTLLPFYASVRDDHLAFVGDSMQPLPDFGLGSDPLCGTRIEPLLDPAAWTGAPGPLEGVHGLSLQWLGGDPADWGEVTFRTAGPGLYLINGRQGVADQEPGDFLLVYGIAEHRPNNELHFKGLIRSRVSFLNGGQSCQRVGRQVLRSDEGRRAWRLQDELNCDLATADYIDIHFD